MTVVKHKLMQKGAREIGVASCPRTEKFGVWGEVNTFEATLIPVTDKSLLIDEEKFSLKLSYCVNSKYARKIHNLFTHFNAISLL